MLEIDDTGHEGYKSLVLCLSHLLTTPTADHVLYDSTAHDFRKHLAQSMYL